MLIFYPIIIALGVYSSYTDIKFHKIKNNHLLFATVCGLMGYAYLIAGNKIALDINLIVNILFAFILGLMLYLADVWGAGDAKLFFVFCLLMPSNKYAWLFPFSSIAIFINIFLFSFIALLILSAGKIVKNKNKILAGIFPVKAMSELIKIFMTVFSLGWAVSYLSSLITLRLSPFLHILMIYFSYILFFRLANKTRGTYLIYLLFGLGLILRLILQPNDFTFFFLSHYATTSFIYTVIFYLLRNIFSLNKKSKENNQIIPFAPFIFLGTLITNTNFLLWAMNMVRIFKK
ncbi:MAG: hypothetical protein COV72_06675 [Candidatus Omnitrophica bacterium CG11_big_fil_rev_8_21_14_0_20_42_13]|uniref:Prepilin type IV endopeptidase peptidase domain-containing protein n=1 Tax=Candidatus Ghiorseimicrobium undicola TaxID=1974746 RepID=A0A2H0LWI0_9BACT|nr:MAG: hypothetical protein COV72_06675 [Candidatus Omnitrophica bacterium CG11_big_fil_rev_8_21_14_0_20_42_13]